MVLVTGSDLIIDKKKAAVAAFFNLKLKDKTSRARYE